DSEVRHGLAYIAHDGRRLGIADYDLLPRLEHHSRRRRCKYVNSRFGYLGDCPTLDVKDLGTSAGSIPEGVCIHVYFGDAKRIVPFIKANLGVVRRSQVVIYRPGHISAD